jgi:uncharacterized iron-regulated protein
MKKIFLILIAFILLTAAKEDRPAYRLYNAKGKSVGYNDLLKAAAESDIVFFGEIHNNPICHWLELQLTEDLFREKGQKLVLGAEMLERDNQLLLNEYLSGMIRKKDFEAEAKLWPNYKTDYAPLVDFAKENGIKFVATNIPRRFAAIVNLKGLAGLDSINAVERGMIAPLPLKYNPSLKCYREIAEMTGAGSMHNTENLARAQAIKDATMAHFILKNRQEDQLFLHYNGSYHSESHEGLVWYATEYNKRTAVTLRILVIASVEQDTISSLSPDNTGKGDFILCIPSDMTKTQEPPASMPMMSPAPTSAIPRTRPAAPAPADTAATEEEDSEAEED